MYECFELCEEERGGEERKKKREERRREGSDCVSGVMLRRDIICHVVLCSVMSFALRY